MRLLFKEVTKTRVTGVTGVTAPLSPVSTGLSADPVRLHLDDVIGVTRVTETEDFGPVVDQWVTPVTPEQNSGVTAQDLLEAAPAVTSSDELHRLHQLHRKMARPENNCAQSFSELMNQASNVLRCRVDELPIHHFEQWEIDSINAGTFWCGKRENNMLLEWAVFNLKTWMNKQ